MATNRRGLRPEPTERLTVADGNAYVSGQMTDKIVLKIRDFELEPR